MLSHHSLLGLIILFPAAVIGQELIASGASAAEPENYSVTTVNTPTESVRNTVRLISNKTVATWVNMAIEENKANLYALHKSYPLGSVIQVQNPMNDRTVEVKVVGRLPGNMYPKNVQVVISAAAAKKLGVLDEKFVAIVKLP